MRDLDYDPDDITYDWSYMFKKKKVNKNHLTSDRFLKYKKNIPHISKAYQLKEKDEPKLKNKKGKWT